MKIVTHYDPPPIPVRQMDWTAVSSNYDAGDPIGYGATEAEAIADLRERLEMETDAPCEGCPDPACKHYEVAGHEPVCARKRSQFDDEATEALR